MGTASASPGFWAATPLPDGRTRHERPFGWAKPLGDGETLWVLTSTPGEVSVNGVALGVRCEVRVSMKLLSRNRLVIVTDGEMGEVALEVRQGERPA